MEIKVLLVEDDRTLRQALADTLEIGGFAHLAVGSAEEALQAVAREPFSLVVSDVNMPGMDGHQLLAQLGRHHPQLPVLLMTAHAAVERAVDAMRQGAVDYLVKPFEPKALISLVERHAAGHLEVGEEEGPVACEPASLQLLDLAARVARSDSTVLISGESGTGKEVLARFIHQQSPRAAAPFVAINCAAIPDNMLEATLFGHEKGAFTGAIAAQAGKFEQADGGTLLLDEISEMPLALQAKLLRVLQEREVERVGGRKPIALISGCWPPPTAIWLARWRPGASVKTSIIACRCSHWPGAPCASARGHPAAGRASAGAPCRQDEACAGTPVRRCPGLPAGARLAGQCARTGQRLAAGADLAAGRGDRGGGFLSGGRHSLVGSSQGHASGRGRRR